MYRYIVVHRLSVATANYINALALLAVGLYSCGIQL